MMRTDIPNREGEEAFNVHWTDPGPDAAGVTSVLRVKNEARSLPWVLPGLLRVTDHVILVDNASDDGTPDVASRIAQENDASEKLTVFDYPFSIARCGAEHLAAPGDSVHSLTHFYNWSFSHVKTTYCMKWDGDMVLTEDGETYIEHLRWQLEAADVVVQIPRYAVYIESDDVAYLDAGAAHLEAWLWPNKPAYYFGKAFDWEILVRPPSTRVMRLPPWTVFELKWLDTDEFTNWTDTDFKQTERLGRKTREWAVFNAIRGGDMPPGVHRIESPGDRHVIELLRGSEFARYVDKEPLAALAGKVQRALFERAR